MENTDDGERSVMPTSPGSIAPTPLTSIRPSTVRRASPPGYADEDRLGGTLSRGRIFGPHTDEVLGHYALPRHTHTILRRVGKDSSEEDWVGTLRGEIRNCTDDVAHDLVEAMKADCKSSTTPL